MKVIKVDDNGLFTEDVLLDSIPVLTEEKPIEEINPDTGETITKTVTVPKLDENGNTIPDPHYITAPYENVGFILPKWDGAQWVEGGTVPTPQPQPPTVEDRLKALEDAQLASMLGGV